MSVSAPAARPLGLRHLKVAIPPRVRALSRVAPWLALVGAEVGAIVLVGWYAGVPALRSVVPGLVTMKVNTAFGLVALGLAVALLSVRHPAQRARVVAWVLAGSVVVLAVATLLEYVLGISIGIDQLLRQDDDTNLFAPFPGRMAVATTFAFMFAGTAVLVSAAGRRSLAALLAVGSLAVAWLSLLGVMYGVQDVSGPSFGTQMSIHTALAHALIAIAILIGPIAGGTSVLSRPTIGGSAARRVAVAAVILMPIGGLVRLAGARAEFLEIGLSVTLMTVSSTIGAVVVAIWLGRSIERVTAQRDAAAADLAAMFARYRAATEGSLDAFFIFAAVRDPGGHVVDFSIVDLNQRAAAMPGLSVDAVIRRRITELFSVEQTRQFIEAYRSVVESGETVEAEFTVGPPTATMRLRQQIVKAGDGVAVVSRDVTERVRAREALAAVNRELEERNADLRDFASVVSHDIRAPLRRIQMYGEQLELDAGDRLGADLPLLQRIRASAGKLEQLVAELMEYARVDEGDRPFQLVDLRVLVGEVLEDLELPLRESGGSVHVGDLPAVSGEPALLRQLFTNLIGNSIKFHRPDAVLRVDVTGRVTRDEDGRSWTEIVVRDNGIGFDQQYADRIFKIFERLHGDRDYAGTGIGLAICRKIALYHKGTIEATGRHGEGATFTVRLPRPAVNGILT